MPTEITVTGCGVCPNKAQWISVKDKFPDDLQVVLCAFQIGEPLVLTYIIGDDVGRFYMDFKPCNYFEDFTALVTHWQPIVLP